MGAASGPAFGTVSGPGPAIAAGAIWARLPAEPSANVFAAASARLRERLRRAPYGATMPR
ncbi:hypothetical protein ACFQHO_26500 [Actinomadura yumaensis]|uniref:hypothetical protein n=1 Tax=Actinomadura yumaensis TaxID=111807 RepID=UPI0036167F73